MMNRSRLLKKILINASNLHCGGGVQVAASFISDLLSNPSLCSKYYVTIFVSSRVHENILGLLGSLENLPFNYFILNIHGLRIFNPSNIRLFLDYDLVFSVFGPFYIDFFCGYTLVGFAQPWILYPCSVARRKISFFANLLHWFDLLAKAVFFSFADHLIVETKIARHILYQKCPSMRGRVSVASNCVSDIYFHPTRWDPLPKTRLPCKTPADRWLGLPSRNYPHKNLDFIASVYPHLCNKELNYTFLVTLTDDEWNACSNKLKSCCVNIGPLTLAQCPTFYRMLDGVFFPSLLEVFSATPYEAFIMERPLFACDLPFNRDLCRDHCFYFQWDDAGAAASCILKWFGLDSLSQSKWLAEARSFVHSRPSSLDRTHKYMSFIDRCI